MLHLPELSLPAAQQLALDECLLFSSDGRRPGNTEYFRVWELATPVVIIGRSSRWEEEVDVVACRRLNVPIYRRCSGGATIVGGPGCLFYSVVLSVTMRPELRSIERTHQFVLSRMSQALRDLGVIAEHVGVSDLALRTDDDLRKISGNSLRVRRNSVLYHGTLLYHADVDGIGNLLRSPPRQPDYRAGRSHTQFLANLDVDRHELRQAIMDAWSPMTNAEEWPLDEALKLAAEKYETPEWNRRL